jgi:hypothetical protein
MAAAPETKGFFQALQANPEVPGKAILSIHKSTAGSTAQALNNLATVALSAWQQIDYKEFASDQWNSKQLAQDIFSRLFPFPEAVREIDHDFSAGFNKNYQEVWNLVKPLLKDELYAFQKNPKDWDNQTGVREKLRAALQHEKQLRLSLGTLLSQVACQPMG